MIEVLASITCSCGKVFQEVKEITNDDGEAVLVWDEPATAEKYGIHLERFCPIESNK